MDEVRTFRDSTARTPGPATDPEEEGTSSDDPDAEAERAEYVSEAGSLDPVTLSVVSGYSTVFRRF